MRKAKLVSLLHTFQMAQGPVTRSQSGSPHQHGAPQLIPVRKPIKGEANAASSSDAKKAFLHLMGLTKADIQLLEGTVCDQTTAELVATALNHVALLPDAEDPYFTPDQWDKLTEKAKETLRGFAQLVQGGEVPPSDHPLFDEYSAVETPTCKCIAHANLQYEWIWRLLDIPEPVTDDWGTKLACALILLILETAAQHRLLPACSVESSGSGSLYTVNFILQLPSGLAQQFTGWPDFTVTRRFTPLAQERIVTAYSYSKRSQRLCAIGEIQSPPGNSNCTKTETFAQAGIYGVRQLVRNAQKKMAVIILFKDKSAQVAVATAHSPVVPLQGSVGEVEYKCVERLDSLSLKDPSELQEFARILVSTMKWTLES